MTAIEELIQQIEQHLRRLTAEQIRTSLDRRFEPRSGTLLKVEHEGAFWHLFPHDFLAVLAELPDRAGAESIKIALESNVVQLWHGPAPPGSRDAH